MKRDPRRIKGALYGVAIGDALGLTVEGMTAQEIQATYGQLQDIVGGGWLHKKKGEVTDDTYMTLCVAAGIAENPDSPYEGIGKRFIGWYGTNPPEIGRCCALAIGKAKELLEQGVLENEAWERASLYAQEQLGGRSAGNGALMRDVYPGLFYPVEKAQRVAERQGKMTHRALESTFACRLYSKLIGVLASGAGKEELELLVADTAYGDSVQRLKEGKVAPSGYVVETLMCAVASVLDGETAEQAILKAVNLGGDADTIGAVAGGLAGALWGFEELPQRWVQALDPDVCALLDQAVQAAVEHTCGENPPEKDKRATGEAKYGETLRKNS